jgi:thiosulfate/3-mercaptopyruvate sulfurtransferase
MSYTTLISTAVLGQHLGQADWAIIDCRHSLADTELGHRNYLEGHIPGALYAHLEEDLSGPIIPGQTGRHPLPAVETFAATLSGWGIDETVQVVVYDDMGGAIAARLWWMLRWLGHEAVAVLDGSWQRWLTEDRLTVSQVQPRPTRPFNPKPQASLLASAEEVLALRRDPTCRLLDARSADRFRGENETLDPIGGHIPGAVSAPYAENLESGHFRSPEALRQRFEGLLGQTSPEQAVVYCGSGVTAAHNLLAMTHAGLDGARLYAGSWSEWVTDSSRPVATGDET